MQYLANPLSALCLQELEFRETAEQVLTGRSPVSPSTIYRVYLARYHCTAREGSAITVLVIHAVSIDVSMPCHYHP